MRQDGEITSRRRYARRRLPPRWAVIAPIALPARHSGRASFVCRVAYGGAAQRVKRPVAVSWPTPWARRWALFGRLVQGVRLREERPNGR